MKEITEWLHSLDGISNIIAVDKLAHWIWVFFSYRNIHGRLKHAFQMMFSCCCCYSYRVTVFDS